MTGENNRNPQNGDEGADPEFHSQYPGSGYPRPSSVQPPSSGSNYPYPLPPESGASNYPYSSPPESNPQRPPSGYSQPPNYGGEPAQSPREWLETMRRQPQYTEQVAAEDAEPALAPLPLPLHPVLATYALLGVMILMFVVSIVVDKSTRGLSFSNQFSSNTLIDLGALYSPLVRQGEWWRLLTVMFLHANAIHILLNGFNMYILGKQLEALYGPLRYTAIFFISGFTGSVVSFALHNDILGYTRSGEAVYGVLGVGASGAIFGLLGAMIGYFLRQRHQFGVFGQRYLRSLLTTAGLNLAILFLIPGIDNFAHLGGLIGGIVLGYLISPLYLFSQSPDGRLRISQRDTNNYTWVFFSLGWLLVAIVAFIYSLNR